MPTANVLDLISNENSNLWKVFCFVSSFIATRLTDKDCQIIHQKLELYYENHIRQLIIESRKLNVKEAALVRGYFLLVLALHNATRAGEHINLLMDWVLSAQQEKSTGQFVIKVGNR